MPNGPRHLPLIALGALAALTGLIVVGAYIYRDSGVLVNEHGSGPGGETTEVFTANGDWDLRWSYDCSSSLGNQYPKLDTCDFNLAIKDISDCGMSAENPGITRHGAPDHGVVHYHTAGTFYFVIDAYGSWTFAVTGAGRGWGVGPAPHCTSDG